MYRTMGFLTLKKLTPVELRGHHNLGWNHNTDDVQRAREKKESYEKPNGVLRFFGPANKQNKQKNKENKYKL